MTFVVAFLACLLTGAVRCSETPGSPGEPSQAALPDEPRAAAPDVEPPPKPSQETGGGPSQESPPAGSSSPDASTGVSPQQPEAAKPDAAQPDAAQPGAAKPKPDETSKTAAAEPGAQPAGVEAKSPSQPQPPGSTPSKPAGQSTDLQEREPEFEVRLSLDDAMRMGLENNLNIKISRLDERIGQRAVIVANAVFDPFFNMGASYGKNRDPTVSAIDLGFGPTFQGVGVNPSETLSYFGSLTGTYVLGTQYELKFAQNERDRPNVNTAFTLLNPIATTDASAALTQPLLKGGWYGVNTADLRIAENNARLSKDQLELTVMDTVFQIEQAYWGAVFSTQNVEAKRKAIALSQENLDNVRKKRDVGKLASIDVTAAESQTALRRVELEEAILLAENARDALLDLINYAKDQSLKQHWESRSKVGPFDNIRVICTTEPTTTTAPMKRDEALAAAFTRRPEYRQLDLNVQNQEIRLDVANNALLPSLDLTARWDQLGLESSFDESISEMATGRYYDWLAGIQFSMPLSNRGPRSLYRNARDELGKLKYQKNQLENQIVLEVDQAIRKIESLRREASSLDERIRLQQELLQAERLKMEVGTSILYLVNVIANDLVDNVTQALQVKANLQIARASLLRATGTILDWHKIQVISD